MFSWLNVQIEGCIKVESEEDIIDLSFLDVMLRIVVILSLLLLSLISAVKCATFFDLLKEYTNKSIQVTTTYYPKWKNYDFIIIGAGSGGSVLANRLSENKNWKILLLEAGYQENLFHQIPVITNVHQLTDYNWGYNVEPQQNTCFGMINRQCAWPRGKSLGGTSILNNMILTRGHKLDFDYWKSLGNDGWSYEDVLPYYIKSEKFDIPSIINSSYHGKDGYLCVEYVPFHTVLSTAFLEAGKKLGYDIIDYNGEKRIGFSYLQVNMDKGARCSASKAYLRVKRPNLNIVTGARVTKILIDEDRRAYGVQYVKDNKQNLVFSTKEVLLSAGTIDSAKLLMLSGIGPKEHLQKLGIKVIQDSKVGYNMYEHIGFFGLVFLVNQPVSLILNNLLNPRVLLDYIFKRSNLISSPGGAEALAFIRTKYASSEKPDIELLFTSATLHSDNGKGFRVGQRITDELYNTIYKPIENRDAWSIWPIIQSPRSVGRLTLTSKDPFVPPKLEPNFFSHPDDVEILLEGIKYAINISKTEPFLAFNSQLHNIKIPGCESYEFASDNYWRCAIKYLPSMMNHEIGTVKMGPKTDPYAVVDSRLKVYGIKKLRVVDASIMPTIPIGHVNAGIFMIGEKAADMIKQDWQETPHTHTHTHTH